MNNELKSNGIDSLAIAICVRRFTLLMPFFNYCSEYVYVIFKEKNTWLLFNSKIP